MKKTETLFGVCAGIAGLILAVLSLFLLLPYASETVSIDESAVKLYAVFCLAANIAGLAGALFIKKNNIIGSAIMTAAVIVILLFGFPWQSISAVMFFISIVMALAPDQINTR